MIEKALIKKCRQGNKAAQYQLVKQYAGMLMTVSRRYVPDEATAKDILQESLIRIFKYLHTYKEKGTFEAWMRRITVRCALQWLNKKHLKKERAFSPYTPQQSSEPKIYGHLHSEEIIQIIQTLPIGFRTVFNLYAIEGYSHKEVAELLGISESTSRSQLTRARKLLQQKITNSEFVSHLRNA